MKRPVILVAALTVAGCTDTEWLMEDTIETTTTTEALFTGDWRSREAYISDIIDTTIRVINAMRLVEEAMEAAIEGHITEVEFGDHIDASRIALGNRRGYFRGTTAPAGFEDSHRYFLACLDSNYEALEKAALGVRQREPFLLEEGDRLMDEGKAFCDLSSDSLPRGLSHEG